MPSVQWFEPKTVDIPASTLEAADGQPFLAELLIRRGLVDAAKIHELLHPSAYQPASPKELPDLSRAADRIELAIQLGEMIGVWGDFDVDGQTSTTLLVSALRRLGARVAYYIPVRARESHGIQPDSLRVFLAKGVQLLLTCDTGITAHAAVELAAALGVETIITDHHGLPPELPPAYAVVNPQRLSDPAHSLVPLCGVGVAYKLAEELYTRAGRFAELASDLDLVALGTVADVALLTGENRHLVLAGLECLRESPRLAVQAMLELASVEIPRLNEDHIGFLLAPRLNALGRLDDANPAVDFLTTTDPSQARLFAARLEGLNSRRKLLCDQVFDAARAQIEQDHTLLDTSVLVLSHADWPAGVIGIVASHLVDLYHRPVVLLSAPPGQTARGSARSVEGVHITRAIAACSELLLGFGGHPMAAGLSLDPQRIPEFRRSLARAVDQQTAGQPRIIELPVDAWLPFERANLELVESLDKLAPFGAGNPSFTFAARQMVIKSFSTIGRTREHLRVIVEEPGGMQRKVLWWQGAGLPVPEGPFDLAYHLRASNFRGQPEVEVEWVSARQEQEVIDLSHQPARFSIEDFRQEADLQAVAANLLENYLVWQEGIPSPAVAGLDRLQLTPCPTLVIATIPPGRAELQQALELAAPHRVILCGLDPGLDQPDAFLRRLVGLVQHALKARQGQVSLPQLAAACAQREAVVRSGLEWLAARGEIVIQTGADNQIRIERGGRSDPTIQSRREKELRVLLQETAAYRAYFLRAEPEHLLE